MKKVVLKSLYDYLTTHDVPELAEAKAELEAEFAKDEKRKAATADKYASFHDLVIDNLTDTPVTLAELFDDIKGDLPEGIEKPNVQYALTRLWKSEVKVIEGKPNQYCKA